MAESTEKRSYKYCKECRAAKTLPMVPSDEFKKVANLLNSGIDIYHYLKPFKPRIETGIIIHNSGHKDVAKALLNKDLCNYRTNCELCQANLRKIRCILRDISVIKHHEAIGICTHCRENYANTASRCPRCEDVAKKFLTRQLQHYNAKEKQLREWIENVQRLLQSILAAGRGKGCGDAEYEELAKLLESPICSPEALITAFPSIYEVSDSEQRLRGPGYAMRQGETGRDGSDLDLDERGEKISEELKKALLRQKYMAAKLKKLGDESGGETKSEWFSADFLRQVMRHQKTKGKKKYGDGTKKKGRKGRLVCTTDQDTVNPSSDTISTLLSEGDEHKAEAVDILSVISLPVARRRIAMRIKRAKRRIKQVSTFKQRHKFTNSKESLMNFFKTYENTYSSSTDVSKKHQNRGDTSPGKEEDEQALIAKFFKQYLNMDLITSQHRPKVDKPATEDDLDVDSSSLDIDIEKCTGITSYRLSNDYFIRNGWTQLPFMKTLRRIKIYRMIHHKQEYNWFDIHRHQEVIFYHTGEKLAEIGDHYGRWFYRNGKVALQYLAQSTDPSVQRIYQIYSSGEPLREIDKPLPVRLLAAFDYFGNGIVYDAKGRIRLQYNQFEGCIEDPEIGTPGKWKWHTLNDPPLLEFEFIENHCGPNSPVLEDLMQPDRTKSIPFDAKMIAIECQNVTKIKMAYQQFNPLTITMKILKLNKYISIRVIDQQHIYLQFRDGKTSMKINLGMQLVSNDVVDLVHVDISRFVFLQPRESLATGEADLLVQHGAMTGLFDREVNTTPPSPSLKELKDSESAAMIERKSGLKHTSSSSKVELKKASLSYTKVGELSTVPTEVAKKPGKPMARTSVEVQKQKVDTAAKPKGATKENQVRNKQLEFSPSALKHGNASRTKRTGTKEKKDPLSSSTTKATINTTPKSEKRK